jgi:phage terminase small subunit
MSITAQKQKFIEAYLLSSNATHAAIEAGYSAHTAQVQGSRLMSEEDIKAALQHARCEASKRTNLTIDDLLLELEAARKSAKANSMPTAMIAATMAKAKILGLDKPAEKEKPPFNSVDEFDRIMTVISS